MNRIILAGIKHSGKSTIGWELSSRLSLYFADLDDLILRDAKDFKTIRELYRTLGADGFKKQEYESLKHFLEVNENKQFVLSLGGGTIENKKAVEYLNSGSVETYYLDASCTDLYDRIIKGGIPPFLEGEDPVKKFEDMYKKRSILYKNWSNYTIDTRGLKPTEIAKIIENQITEKSTNYT